MKDILKIEKILVLDSGQQAPENIVRQLRQLDVYSELLPYESTAQDIHNLSEVTGLILINPEGHQDRLDPSIYDLDLPILSIGQGGIHLLNHYQGRVSPNIRMDSGLIDIQGMDQGLFAKVTCHRQVDLLGYFELEEVPAGFEICGQTEEGSVFGLENTQKNRYALSFNPYQVSHECGLQVLKNFVFNICGAQGNWKRREFLKLKLASLREEIGPNKVLLGLSGGVDSSVLGVLLHEAIGDQLVCVFINHGLLRKNESSHIITALEEMGLNIIRIDAQDEFRDRLEGITDPNDKRRAVRDGILDIIFQQMQAIPEIKHMAIGTLYSNLIEFSINSHGLVQYYLNHSQKGPLQGISLIQPFKALFKNEVAQLGKELGLPDSILKRQPFPDAGFAVRAFGEVTQEKVMILRESDAILREEVAINDLDEAFSQYFTVLPNVMTSSYEGDRRSYGHMIGLRLVSAIHPDRATVGHLPWQVLERIVQRIINEVPGVSRVVYDVTPKPPAMVEWE